MHLSPQRGPPTVRARWVRCLSFGRLGAVRRPPRDKSDRWAKLLAVAASLALGVVIYPTVRSLMRWGQPDVLGFLALGAGLSVVVYRLLSQPQPEARGRMPRAPWVPAVAVGGAALCSAWALRGLEIPLAAALLSGLALYGLAGLWLAPTVWRALLVPALIILGALPVGQRAEGWFGLPARLWSADVAYRVLAWLGVEVDSAQTVLVFENGLTEVAAACSGLRGLWTALILLLFIAALERRRVGWRLATVIAAAMVALLAGNTIRIVILIAVGMVLKWPHAASALHEPLGLTVFAVVIGSAFIALRWWVPADPGRSVGGVNGDPPPLRLTPYLVASAAVAVAAVATVAVVSERPSPMAEIRLPSGMRAVAAPLIAAETMLAQSFAGGRIDKVRFDHQGVRGQLILLQARSWRAQHPPELCLTMAGHRITSASDVVLQPDHRVRALSIDGGRRLAVYWYQNQRIASPNLWAKVQAMWFGQNAAWVMVSFLFDAGPSSTVLPEATIAAVHDAVQHALGAEDSAQIEVGARGVFDD